jgi:hypothetical protein
MFCGQANDDVAQFADIAGEGVVRATGFALRGEVEGLLRLRAHSNVAEMVEQQQAVVAHLAQRRYNDRTDRQAVVEVGAEVAGLDLLAQVAVGGGNDARRLMRFWVSPTRWYSPFSSTRSSLACSSSGQLADLVEKQRAVAGVFEIAGLGARWRR